MSIAWLLLYALALYALIGAVVGAAFVSAGVTRVLGQPVPVSPGARILLFPASAALWPFILKRWLAAGRDR